MLHLYFTQVFPVSATLNVYFTTFQREIFDFLLYYIYLITLVTSQIEINKTKYDQQINYYRLL